MLFVKSKPNLGFISASSPKCLACKRDKEACTPKFKVSGKGEHEILLIFGEPSDIEDYTGRAARGDQYNAVCDVLESKGLDFKIDCWKTHAVNCHSDDNDIADKHIEYCSPYVSNTIKSLKPKLIICFGGEAAKAVLRNRFSDCSAGRWRGIPLYTKEYNAHLMVTFDPSKFSGGMDSDTYKEVIENDILVALRLLKRKPPVELNPNIRCITDFKEICTELKLILRKADSVTLDYETTGLKLILRKADSVTLDYETTGLKPTNSKHVIAANSFTYTVGDQVETISYPISYAGWFTENQEARIKELTAEILKSDIPKIGHHIKFEEIWGHEILETKTRNWIWCTMYTAHVLDERPKHVSLKTQAYIHFQAEPYEDIISPYLKSKDGGGNSINRVHHAPLMDLLYYNGLDTFYTYYLYLKQKKIIEKDPNLFPINQLFLEGAQLFADMEKVGFGVIPGYFALKDTELKHMIKEKKTIIMGTKEVAKYNKKFKRKYRLGSDDDLYKMIYGVMKTSQDKMTKKGNASTDAEVLMGLEKKGSIWAKEYLEYTKLCTARDTFVSQMLKETDEHDRIHPFYHLFTTRTGRSSSTLPNF